MESNIRAFDMDDEFALCWNNFQDNLSSGFQTLFDRGDLVDVTLAVDGKLLQAHKIVLAICSPYFQEMFITNPCKHPIIILKDVTFHVMSELLQFMYQGVVNVKHTDLAAFMKIAQSLQIKGLAAIAAKLPINYMQSNNSNNSNPSKTNSGNATEPIPNANVINTKTNATLFSNKEDGASPTTNANKRHIDFNGAESLTMFTRKIRRSLDTTENDISADSMENMSSDEMFLPPIPQISMMESSRFDIHNVKRETEPLLSPGGIRNIIPPGFNFEYNSNVYSKNVEYPNDLHMSNDYPKTGAGNHMDIPAGGNITMLSSTSLLHGNCIFNRNNTVATQQGMKTYWLCKSYRITMCRARCITHQGRVISATGVHNHQPHMKGQPPSGPSEFSSPNQPTTSSGLNTALRLGTPVNQSPQHNVLSQNTSIPQLHQAQLHAHHQNQHQQQQQHQQPQQQQQHHHQSTLLHSPPQLNQPQHHQSSHAAIQNMMHNVLSQNSLMQLSNIAPILNPLQHHSSQLPHIHPPSSLQITPILNATHQHNIQSPTTSPRLSHTQQHSPNIQQPQHPMTPNNNNNTNSNMSIVVSSSTATPSSASPNEEVFGKMEATVSQDNTAVVSQSNIISSITISPTQQTFKMEHI
ncbi:myb-like protein I [Bradysia coprophila]|uniref:myb-like protein I n=1 Tax=Bradysia coprophila TaxID=38358 RepID=UPI00187D805E|nr:myb-like protein I [Bradysia coprophila]